MIEPFRLAAVLALATGLTACASAQDRVLQKSQPYRAGYADGCSAATSAGANYSGDTVRNEDAYKTNSAYRKGWNTGYRGCRRAAPGADRTMPLDMPGPGH